jgi:hypothetical protein
VLASRNVSREGCLEQTSFGEARGGALVLPALPIAIDNRIATTAAIDARHTCSGKGSGHPQTLAVTAARLATKGSLLAQRAPESDAPKRAEAPDTPKQAEVATPVATYKSLGHSGTKNCLCAGLSDGPGRDRTYDLGIKSPLLYQLSYRPLFQDRAPEYAALMGKGYAEGSAVEERLAALERGDDLSRELDAGRAAVYGSTEGDPETHFLGWLDDIDPDALFASGDAWGLQIVRRKKS